MSKAELVLVKKRLLSDCEANECFWTGKGTTLRNVYELISCLESGDEYVFRYHVNTDNHKNDFALWIRAVFKDDYLADKLDNVFDRKKYLQIIKKRVLEIEES